jgi:hypothetical protein
MSREAMSELTKDANSLRSLKKLVEEGVVRLQVLHKYGCCTYFTAIHPCDCGAEEKARKVNELLRVEQKATKRNEEVEWDEEAEHYDCD